MVETNSSSGSRTLDAGVKNRSLNRLTNEPILLCCLNNINNNTSLAKRLQAFFTIYSNSAFLTIVAVIVSNNNWFKPPFVSTSKPAAVDPPGVITSLAKSNGAFFA